MDGWSVNRVMANFALALAMAVTAIGVWTLMDSVEDAVAERAAWRSAVETRLDNLETEAGR